LPFGVALAKSYRAQPAPGEVSGALAAFPVNCFDLIIILILTFDIVLIFL